MMKTLLRGGTIVTASCAPFEGDLLVEGERIAAVGPRLEARADRTIEAAGRYVIPGAIDVHTHLDMPSGDLVTADDFESGTIAAAFGGTTTIVDYATPEPGQSLHAALDLWKGKARGKAAVDYGFHMVLREPPEGRIAREIVEMVAEGVTSFKVFMAYRALMLDDGAILRVLEAARRVDALVAVHAENGTVIDVLVRQALAEGFTEPKWHALTRPARLEAEAVHRAVALAEMAGAPVYVVHVSSVDALSEIEEARRRGVPALGETCPQYLFLDQSLYDLPGFEGAKYVMSPPLRAKGGQARLLAALGTGALATVATDHCPFRMKDQKVVGQDDFSRIPNGAPGIEHRLALLYDGGPAARALSLERWVDVTSTRPARLFGLYPRKGALEPGSDADVVLFDPRATQTLGAATHHMRVDYDPYEGRTVRGQVELVMSRGRVIVEGGRFTGAIGSGRFLARGKPEIEE